MSDKGPETAKKFAILQSAPKIPNLRMVLWLYLAIFAGTMLIMVELSAAVEPLFLRFATTIFIVLGLMLIVTRVFKLSVTPLLGRSPEPISLIASVIAGLLIWVPFFWSIDLMYGWLEKTVGALPLPLVAEAQATPYFIQYVIVIPLIQGLLFFGFILQPAKHSFRVFGVFLTAVLFGFYGLFGTDAATSAIPGFFVVGLLAGFAVYFTDSIWYGVAILAGFNLGLPLLRDRLLFDYFNVQVDSIPYDNLISVRWLMAIAVTGFLAFALLQVIRLRATPDTKPSESVNTKSKPSKKDAPLRSAYPGHRWWIPLILSGILMAFSISAEFTLRARSRPAEIPSLAQTPPPDGAPAVPIPGK